MAPMLEGDEKQDRVSTVPKHYTPKPISKHLLLFFRAVDSGNVVVHLSYLECRGLVEMSVQSRTHWAMEQKQSNHTLSRSFAAILKLSAGLVACFLWFSSISPTSLGLGTVL